MNTINDHAVHLDVAQNGGSLSAAEVARSQSVITLVLVVGHCQATWVLTPMQVESDARLAQVEVRAEPISELDHHDRVGVRISSRMPAGRAGDVLTEDLGGLVAELAQQHARPGGNPYGEAVLLVLAELQLADPCQQGVHNALGLSPMAGTDRRSRLRLLIGASPAWFTTMRKHHLGLGRSNGK